MNHADLVIIGGGLAGLTLALQCAGRRPATRIMVIERRRHPLPRAIAKVGESTVEIGAHYLDAVLGQREHLAGAQLPKFGLRCFFGGAGADLAEADELGVSQVLAVPTYQVDRGVLENHLADEARAAGIEFIDGARVKSFELDADSNHTVTFESARGDTTVGCRWLVDAAGRNSPLKTRLGLAEPSHHDGNAVWFRVDGHIVVDHWSRSDAWQARVTGSQRWLSTNHLMGPGYWVWLIPLAGDVTSVGIVTDPSLHDVDAMKSFEQCRHWLAARQPRLAAALKDRELLDFRVLRNYSYACRRVFSADRWCLTGEAGVFLDPFYSPGTDFIAIANTLITDLVCRELDGGRISIHAEFYQKLYRSLFDSTLEIYRDLYPGFGDRELMPVKMCWDYAYYWGILCQLFFNGALTDIELMASLSPALRRVQSVNVEIQSVFRSRARQARQLPPRGLFVDQRRIHLLRSFNEALLEPVDASRFRTRIEDNVASLESLAGSLIALLEDPSGPAGGAERALVGDLRRRLAA